MTFPGAERRGPLHLDRPANSLAAAANGLMMISEARYGFRCADDSICLKLLRSSTDPDPIPEICIHKMMFALSLPEEQEKDALIRKAQAKYTDISLLSGRHHQGTLPAAGAFLKHALIHNAQLSIDLCLVLDGRISWNARFANFLHI